MIGRLSVRILMVGLGGTGAVVAFFACSDSGPPTGSGNTLIDDSHHSGDELPPAMDPSPADALPEMLYPSDAVAEYAPALDTCAACTCDPATNFCFAGGMHARSPFASMDASDEGGEGGDAAAATPACPLVSGSTVQVGCNALPPACAASPTCACVLDAIQPQFSCYLVCSPDPGYFRVYCPN
jgi:hypothetical protein